MAAHSRQHIIVQAIMRLVPDAKQRQHAALGLVVSAIFTAFLAVVSARYAYGNFARWIETQGRAGVFDSLPLPYWSVTVAVPLGFGLMLVRFMAQALLIYRGALPPTPPTEEDLAARSLPAGGEA
jgi:TRAP-type C4-dicarboxylate transport system permease small subunit